MRAKLLVVAAALFSAGVGLMAFAPRAEPESAFDDLLPADLPRPAPHFSVTLLDGREFDLGEHLAEDGRPVFLNFWASWCLPCRTEMPALDRASASHPEILFLGVAVEDDPSAAREFAEEQAVAYPLGIDESGVVGANYPFFGLPSSWLIDSEGMIVQQVVGAVSEDTLEELLSNVAP